MQIEVNNMKRTTKTVINKAKKDLMAFRNFAEKPWRCNSKVLLWMYTISAIVRPINSYASVVWCKKKTDLATTRNNPSKEQRLACIAGRISMVPGELAQQQLLKQY